MGSGRFRIPQGMDGGTPKGQDRDLPLMSAFEIVSKHFGKYVIFKGNFLVHIIYNSMEIAAT